MLTALILVGLDGYFRLSLPRNAIKLGIVCILGACLLCIYLLIEVLRAELIIMDRSSPVLELFNVLIPWDNTIIILFGPSEVIHLGIWICS